jgi:hypothetical protein
MTSLPLAFISAIRAKYDAPTDRPGDLEAYLCCYCWHPHLVTGRRGAKVLGAQCCGRSVRLVEAGEITIKARLLRGADDMPELQRVLAKKLAVAAMMAASREVAAPPHIATATARLRACHTGISSRGQSKEKGRLNRTGRRPFPALATARR